MVEEGKRLTARRTAQELVTGRVEARRRFEDHRLFAPETQFHGLKGPVRASALTGQESLQGFAGHGRAAALAIRKLVVKSHKGPIVRITTEHGHKLTVTPDHLCPVQLKPSHLYYDLFLVHRVGLGFVVGLGNGQLRDVTESTILYERQRDGGPTVTERLWMIASFRTLNQASFVEHLLSIRFGLPILDVDPRLRRHGLTEDVISRLLREIDTMSRASLLLKDAGLNERQPHFVRKLLSLQDQARQHYLDAVFFEPTDPRRRGSGNIRHVLRIYALGDGVRFDRDRIRHLGPGGPQTETFDRPRELVEQLAAHAEDAHLDAHRRVSLPLGRPFFLWPASYLREGMIVAAYSGSKYMESPIVQTERADHTGDVVEVELEEDGLVVGGGILVSTGPGLG